MKNHVWKKGMTFLTTTVLMASLVGCSGGAKDLTSGNSTGNQTVESADQTVISGNKDEQAEQTEALSATATLEVQFGDNGETFLMYLEDNDTAAAIAGYVGTSDWRLPIYENDADADYSVLQYYDIPSRYDIPSDPQDVTSAKAGEVYYSDPNRIVLFYHDAEVSAEYTKVGTFDATEEFVTAVEENPVLEGWGNKIVVISQP